MDKSLLATDPALLVLLHGGFGKNGALAPFAREIMLLECQVAGTSYRNLKPVEPGLSIGASLVLKREPANANDPLAIMVLDSVGTLLGYVPRAKNEILARLMDAGKAVFAKLQSKEWQGEWIHLEMIIYLRDQ
jgi:hypothetical protein